MLDTLNALLWRAGLGLTVIALAAATASSASAAAPAHGVWVANGAANTLTEFSFTAGAGSSPIATIASNSGSLHTPSGIALDGHGDLWVANAGNDTIVEYTPDQLAQDGSPVPALTLGSGGGLFRPTGLAFDAASNLWATNVGDSTIVEYTAQQLGEGSNAAPAVTIATDSNHTLDAPVFPAFDVQGDLWVPNLADNTVVEYTPSQLAASGAPAPATTISSTTGAGALDLPWAVRFDAKGDLWVVNRNDDTLLQYAPGNQGTGAQSPSAVITSGSLSSPQGADFDLAGDAWVGSAGSSTVSEFTPGQLGASGSPQAASTISSSALSNPTGIAIAQAPVVTSLTEKQTGAGTEVTITGRGFYPGATVQFGSTPAASVTYLSPFVLKALAPSGSGQVDVTVSTGEGTSAISPGDVYVFGGMSPTLITSNGSSIINLYPLGASGDYAPSAAISAGLSGPTREALDGAGDLWVVNTGVYQTILEYTRVQLQAGDLAAPAATLRLTTSGHPAALAFDASGNLWVALVRSSSPGASGGVVTEILRQQLADGSVSPAVTVATGPVESVAFDHEGDLWTVGAFFDGSVSEYASSELAAGAPRGPVTVLTDDGNGSLATAFALTFDAAGDLWVANAAGSIVKFTPDELQTARPSPPSRSPRKSSRSRVRARRSRSAISRSTPPETCGRCPIRVALRPASSSCPLTSLPPPAARHRTTRSRGSTAASASRSGSCSRRRPRSRRWRRRARTERHEGHDLRYRLLPRRHGRVWLRARDVGDRREPVRADRGRAGRHRDRQCHRRHRRGTIDRFGGGPLHLHRSVAGDDHDRRHDHYDDHKLRRPTAHSPPRPCPPAHHAREYPHQRDARGRPVATGLHAGAVQGHAEAHPAGHDHDPPRSARDPPSHDPHAGRRSLHPGSRTAPDP